MSQRYQVRILKSISEIEEFRALWTSWQDHPNADIDFYSLVVSVRPEVIRPYVILVSEDGEPISLLAGRIEDGHLEIKAGYKFLWRPRVRCLRILYGGYMGRTDATVSEIVTRQLLRSLREENADLLSWDGVRWKSDLQRLLGRMPNLLCREYLSRPSQHWTMNLPACLDELLEQKVNRKSRNEARRTMRVLEKAFPGAVRYACFSAPIEMEKLFEDVIRVARKTYQWGLGVGFQDNEEHRKRLRLEAEKGRLRAYVLYLKDEPVAFWIGTVYKDTFWLDFTGYDPAFCKYEVGTVLFLRMIGNMCGQNVKLMDLGLGSAFYKERFGDSSIEESTMRVFAFSGRGVLFNTVWLVTQALTKVVRGLLLRLGLEQKVKKLWRARSTAAQESTKPLQAEI